MNLTELFSDKALKAKERTAQLSQWLSANPKKVDELIAFAQTAKDPVKAACIEAIEYVSKENPKICTESCFNFVAANLAEESPAVRREAGRVIGNVIALFPKHVEKVLTGLLNNAEDEGTVVRWSAAFALGEIIKLKTALNKDLVPVAEAICEREEQASIQKIYLAALKKAGH